MVSLIDRVRAEFDTPRIRSGVIHHENGMQFPVTVSNLLKAMIHRGDAHEFHASAIKLQLGKDNPELSKGQVDRAAEHFNALVQKDGRPGFNRGTIG